MTESHITDEAGHSLITETQERMVVLDYYITCTVGMTLAIIILQSLITFNKRLKNGQKSQVMGDSKYYKSAITATIISTLSAMLFYLIRFFSMDLILPLDLKNNVDTASLLDSFMLIGWGGEKIAFAFGFSYLYLSLFQKESMDIILKVSLGAVAIGTPAYIIYYSVADMLTTTLDEISVGAKREIYAVLLVNNDMPQPEVITVMIGFFIDLLFNLFLMYRFYSRGNGNNAAKGIVLLSISTAVWIFMWTMNLMNSNFKLGVNSLPTVIDNICLFLMFSDNQELYNNFCGCICCGFGSKYKPIKDQEIDNDDDQQDDDESNQQLVV